jgi:ABC-type sugar transport system ATPase subunit
MERIVKDFSGVKALDNVDFEVCRGEVHALIGENGAGKSTLMNVLAGRFGNYEGEIIFDGRQVRITNPRQARDMGIAVIYQELSVLPNLSVAENIMLGDERAGSWTRKINRAHIRTEARNIVEYLGFDLDPDEPVERLSAARQRLVEIAGNVRRRVKLLVFDEPTASLGSEDVEKLFQTIRDLKAKGLGIVYISHRLSELPQIADRVTVLRDGKKVDTKPIDRCSISEMSRMMMGHVLSEIFPEKTNQPGKRILKVRHLSRKGKFEDISFDLHEGEVLGIAGLVGSGRTEIVRALFGADKADGIVELEGEPMTRRSPGFCRIYGIGMLPEDRKSQGVITDRSVGENLNISILQRLSGFLGFVSPHRWAGQTRLMMEQMRIDPPMVRQAHHPERSRGRPQMLIQNLSGGNQQKVVVGRWLAAQPKVMIFDEPTQGIDIGTKSQIYKLIIKLAKEGQGIILISSELIEVAKLSDRILIIRDGRMAGEMKGPLTDKDVDVLFNACAGVRG